MQKLKLDCAKIKTGLRILKLDCDPPGPSYSPAPHEFSAGIPVISNAEIFLLLLLHVLACSNYAQIVIG